MFRGNFDLTALLHASHCVCSINKLTEMIGRFMRMNCFSHEFHGVRILVKIEIESPIWIEIRSMSKREKPKDRLREREERTAYNY